MPDLEKYDYKITDAPDRTEEELETPAYLQQLDLNKTQKKRLSREFFLEHNAIEGEWQEAGMIKKMDSLDNQYEGKLDQIEGQQFNVHKHTTKVKVDTATRYAKKAFLESDPRFSVSPRPKYAKEGGIEVCEAQQDYLDYKLDEGVIPFDEPIGKVFHSAGCKGIGWLKIPHEIKREKRKREETYVGAPIWLVAVQTPSSHEEFARTGKEESTQPIRMDQEQFKAYKKENLNVQATLIENKGLEDFLSAYPDAPDHYKGYIKKLFNGQEIRIVVEYEDITYDDPLPKYVLSQNMRARLSVEGYEGLKTTKLIDEKMNYTWWELKKEEEKGKFHDIDMLKFDYDDKTGKAKTKNDKDQERKGYENESYDVFEAVYYFKVDEDDDEPIKIRMWIEENSKKVIGVTLYPYYDVECYWVPFYVHKKWAGLMQPGIAEYLTDTNIAENAFLNFMLEGLYISNMVTPITPRDSDLDIQFTEKEWMHGMPLNADPSGGGVDFLQKYMKPPDVGGLVAMMNILTRHGDDVSQISSYTTGKESQIDPDAPARKTLALLQQAGINIEEYIRSLLPSFNEVGKIFLQLTYQTSKEGRKYAKKGKKIEPGKEPEFPEISRAQMKARTNIQSQAMAFDFDKLNEKKSNLALYQVVRQEPLIANNPEAVWFLLRQLIKSWSPRHKNEVDIVLPSIQELKKQQQVVAVQAMAMFMKGVAENAKVTGVQPEFDLKQLQAVMQQAISEIATPPPEEIQKERAKKQKEAAIGA